MQLLINCLDQLPISRKHEMHGENKYSLSPLEVIYDSTRYIKFMGLLRVLYAGIDHQSSRLDMSVSYATPGISLMLVLAIDSSVRLIYVGVRENYRRPISI